jgi:hypothetical protein
VPLSQLQVTKDLYFNSINIRGISKMKRLLWYVSCCWTISLIGAAAAHASPKEQVSERATTGTAASLGKMVSADDQAISTVTLSQGILAQTPPPPPAPTDAPSATPTTPPSPTPSTTPANSDTQQIQNELNTIKENKPQTQPADKFNSYNPKTSPQFAIFNPVGFGADKNLIFISGDYQNRTRFGNKSDGEAGIGIGLGDAVNAVGVELSYSINSFGSSSGFGSGAFNAKVHKRISEDTAVAIGWNQFAQVTFGSGQTDYPKNSYYAVATKIFRTTDDINSPFSRVAVTGGVGGGVFLPFDRNILPSDSRSGLGVFGSLGVRVARPVSAIVEWTGQDLAAGVSIAPFDNFPLVITPAFRDITGISGESARFVLGASVAFNF